MALFLSRADKQEVVFKKAFLILAAGGLITSIGAFAINRLWYADPRNPGQFAELNICVTEIRGHIEQTPQWNVLKSPS